MICDYYFKRMDKNDIKDSLKNLLLNIELNNPIYNTYIICRFVMPLFPDNRYYHIFGWIHYH